MLSSNLERSEPIDLGWVSDENSDLGWRCAGCDDSFEGCASDVASSTCEKDGFSRHSCCCCGVFFLMYTLMKMKLRKKGSQEKGCLYTERNAGRGGDVSL